MVQYIPKEPLLAEIEKAIKIIYAGREYVGIPYSEECIISGLQKAEDIINTFEVKEVDLEKEIELEYNPMDGLSFEEFARIAKHFVELGIKIQKEGKINDV